MIEALTIGFAALSLAAADFAANTHGTGTVGIDTKGAAIGQLRLSNEYLTLAEVLPALNTFGGGAVVVGLEGGLYPTGANTYSPDLKASLELQLLRF